MKDFVFRNTPAPADEADLQALALQIGFELPAAVMQLYRSGNGGVPLLSAWEEESGEYLVISQFMPLGPPEAGRSTIASTLALLLQRGMLAAGLVPFARDWGGNCICFDAAGAVYFCALDVWREEWSQEENTRHATRLLVDSFEAFVGGLQTDPDDDPDDYL